MSVEVLIFLAIASGFAGFVDAMAGGGGLIQLPALIIGLPNKELPLILGTNKVPSIFGTSAAARNYFKNLKFTNQKRLFLVALIGLLIGFYDGIFGPGTGTFLVFFLVSGIGYAFLKASGTAKLVNIATNAGAILSFQITGHIWWQLGLLLAIANVSGAILGSRLAIKGGSPLVRKVFLAVTFLLITRVAWDTFIS